MQMTTDRSSKEEIRLGRIKLRRHDLRGKFHFRSIVEHRWERHRTATFGSWMHEERKKEKNLLRVSSLCTRRKSKMNLTNRCHWSPGWSFCRVSIVKSLSYWHHNDRSMCFWAELYKGCTPEDIHLDQVSDGEEWCPSERQLTSLGFLRDENHNRIHS